jgi:hypothetical protein
MAAMSDRQIVDVLHAWQRQGRQLYRDGKEPPASATPKHYLVRFGWLQESTRCALMRRDPVYAQQQAEHEQQRGEP